MNIITAALAPQLTKIAYDAHQKVAFLDSLERHRSRMKGSANAGLAGGSGRSRSSRNEITGQSTTIPGDRKIISRGGSGRVKKEAPIKGKGSIRSSSGRSGPGQAAGGLKDVAVGTGRTVGKGLEYGAKGVVGAGMGAGRLAGKLGEGAKKVVDNDVGKFAIGAGLLALLGRGALRRL